MKTRWSQQRIKNLDLIITLYKFLNIWKYVSSETLQYIVVVNMEWKIEHFTPLQMSKEVIVACAFQKEYIKMIMSGFGRKTFEYQVYNVAGTVGWRCPEQTLSFITMVGLPTVLSSWLCLWLDGFEPFPNGVWMDLKLLAAVVIVIGGDNLSIYVQGRFK